MYPKLLRLRAAAIADTSRKPAKRSECVSDELMRPCDVAADGRIVAHAARTQERAFPCEPIIEFLQSTRPSRKRAATLRSCSLGGFRLTGPGRPLFSPIGQARSGIQNVSQAPSGQLLPHFE
jgi:hypothetical protein